MLKIEQLNYEIIHLFWLDLKFFSVVVWCTYLIICNWFLRFLWNIRSYCWHAECSVSIFFFPDNIAAIWFGGLTQAFVRLQLFECWLAMDASGCVPGIVTLHISDSVNECVRSRCLSLPQILWNTQIVIIDGAEVLHCFPYDCCFGISRFESLLLQCLSSTIHNFLLTVAESVFARVNSPIIAPLLLLTRFKVPVRPLI